MSIFKSQLIILFFLSYTSHLHANEHLENPIKDPVGSYIITPVDYTKISIAENVRDSWSLNNITDYTYTIINKCFCDIAKRAKIFVYNNKIIKILDLDKGNTPLDPSAFNNYKTINEHIEFINATLQNPVDKVYIDHDRHLGFPSKIFIDPNKRQADDETNINISNLQLLVDPSTLSPPGTEDMPAQ